MSFKSYRELEQCEINSKRGYDPGLITQLKRILLNTNFNPKLCAINIFCDVIVTGWLCW